MLLYGAFTNENGERSASLHDDAAPVVGGGEDTAAADIANVDGEPGRWSTAWRYPARQVGDVLGDVGALFVEALGP